MPNSTVGYIAMIVVFAFIAWVAFVGLVEKISPLLFPPYTAALINGLAFFAPLIVPVLALLIWLTATVISALPATLLWVIVAAFIFSRVLRSELRRMSLSSSR